MGESWGSQIAWKLMERNLTTRRFRARGVKLRANFQVEGLIFAGGFVKHLWSRGVRLRWVGLVQHTPMSWALLRLGLGIYSRVMPGSGIRRCSGNSLASIGEFVARRTPTDRQAMRHRLDLLSTYDPRPVARATRLPVHYLAGLVDPLVPWPLVRRWLPPELPGLSRRADVFGGRITTCWPPRPSTHGGSCRGVG